MTPEERDRYDASENARHQALDREEAAAMRLGELRDALDTEREARALEAIQIAKTIVDCEKRITELQAAERVALRGQTQTFARLTVLRRACARAVSQITHGETRQAQDTLRQATARQDEQSPPEELATKETGIVPVKGRGLVGGRVSFIFQGDGLVVRVDDDERPEWWLEMRISETRLLRLLAGLHRHLHNGDLPRPSEDVAARPSDDTLKGGV